MLFRSINGGCVINLLPELNNTSPAVKPAPAAVAPGLKNPPRPLNNPLPAPPSKVLSGLSFPSMAPLRPSPTRFIPATVP